MNRDELRDVFTNIQAILSLMVAKGICTMDEFRQHKALAQAAYDQGVAEMREKTISSFPVSVRELVRAKWDADPPI